MSLHTQAVIGMNSFDLSVCCLSFSKADGGSLLVAVDAAPEHIISVWEWQKGDNGNKITETKVRRQIGIKRVVILFVNVFLVFCGHHSGG